MDKIRLTSAWLRTRQLNPFLRGRWKEKIFDKFDYTECVDLSEPEYRETDPCNFKREFDKVTNEFTFEKLNELPVPSHLVVYASEKQVQLISFV